MRRLLVHRPGVSPTSRPTESPDRTQGPSSSRRNPDPRVCPGPISPCGYLGPCRNGHVHIFFVRQRETVLRRRLDSWSRICSPSVPSVRLLRLRVHVRRSAPHPPEPQLFMRPTPQSGSLTRTGHCPVVLPRPDPSPEPGDRSPGRDSPHWVVDLGPSPPTPFQ